MLILSKLRSFHFFALFFLILIAKATPRIERFFWMFSNFAKLKLPVDTFKQKKWGNLNQYFHILKQRVQFIASYRLQTDKKIIFTKANSRFEKRKSFHIDVWWCRKIKNVLRACCFSLIPLKWDIPIISHSYLHSGGCKAKILSIWSLKL